MQVYYLGIDLGGTNIKAGLFDENLNLIKKVSTPTQADTNAENVVERLAALVDDLIEKTGIDRSRIVAGGLGTPGPVNLKEGAVVAAPNLPCFKNTPLREMVSQRLQIPFVMEKDSNAACWGEHVIGAGKGIDNMIFLTLGTGVGGGLIVNGQLVHGNTDSAAEFGHIIIYPDGRLCGCGQRGCVEAYSSANSTVARALEQLQKGRKSNLFQILENGKDLTSKDIYQAAAKGDPLAIEITDGTAKALGLLCVSMLHFSCPKRIVLAGGMIAAGDMLLDKIRYYFNKYIWSMKKESVEICFATLGEDAGIIGNASLAEHAHKRNLI